MSCETSRALAFLASVFIMALFIFTSHGWVQWLFLAIEIYTVLYYTWKQVKHG